MTRLRSLLAVLGLLLVLGVAPAGAQETTTTVAGDTPAVVVGDGAPVPADEAWTFRFLVPTVLAISGLVLLVYLVGYRGRLGRYRVVR